PGSAIPSAPMNSFASSSESAASSASVFAESAIAAGGDWAKRARTGATSASSPFWSDASSTFTTQILGLLPHFHRLVDPLEPLLDHGEVLEQELAREPRGVSRSVDRFEEVGHGGILEGAHHEDEGIHVPERRERGEPAPLATRLVDRGGVDVVDLGGGVLLRRVHVAESLEASIGDGDRAQVHALAARRARLGGALRERGEERGLPALRRAENAELHARRSRGSGRGGSLRRRASRARPGPSWCRPAPAPRECPRRRGISSCSRDTSRGRASRTVPSCTSWRLAGARSWPGRSPENGPARLARISARPGSPCSSGSDARGS